MNDEEEIAATLPSSGQALKVAATKASDELKCIAI
jgi:hypothetical protein